MALIEAYKSAWIRSFYYEGRSTRSDYWWFVLANLIVTIVPGLPLAVRRLRDAGKSWPWLLISLIPIIGGIWLIVLFCQPSIGR